MCLTQCLKWEGRGWKWFRNLNNMFTYSNVSKMRSKLKKGITTHKSTSLSNVIIIIHISILLSIINGWYSLKTRDSFRTLRNLPSGWGFKIWLKVAIEYMLSLIWYIHITVFISEMFAKYSLTTKEAVKGVNQTLDE